MSLVETTLAVIPAVSETVNLVPGNLNISPDYDFPGATGVKRIISWVLGGGMTISFLTVIILGITLAFKGFGNQGMQQGASKLILWAVIGLVVLGSASGIWQLIVGFDLGL